MYEAFDVVRLFFGDELITLGPTGAKLARLWSKADDLFERCFGHFMEIESCNSGDFESFTEGFAELKPLMTEQMEAQP